MSSIKPERFPALQPSIFRAEWDVLDYVARTYFSILQL